MTSKEFLQGLPTKINADVIANLSTTFHFDFSEDNGGQVTVKKEHNPMMAMLSGKLKISNQSEMLKFAKVLGWM